MARREQTAAGPGSRALIVDLIRSAGRISRVELAELTGLTQPAVSGIVRKLLVDGVVRESGTVSASRGKPRALLELNSHAVYGIGMHIGPDSITCVATDTLGGVVARQSVDGGGASEPEHAAGRIAELYERFVAAVGLDRASIVGLAVAVPGPLDLVEGRILDAPTLPGWQGFPLRDAVQRRVDAHVVVDNDASAAAIGEYWSRNVSRSEAFATIYLGAGIGAGVVLDGALVRGSSSNTAELGHISVRRDGAPCFCGNIGCLERSASPSAVAEAVRASGALPALGAEHPVDADLFDALARAAVTGDATAAAFVDAAADDLAEGALTLVNLFDLDRIVLAGPGFAIAGSVFARAVQTRLDARAFARGIHPTLVELSIDPRDSAAIGAATLVLQGSVTPGHGPASEARTPAA